MAKHREVLVYLLNVILVDLCFEVIQLEFVRADNLFKEAIDLSFSTHQIAFSEVLYPLDAWSHLSPI